MPTYAYPTRSKTLDTATVATLEDQLNEQDIPQAYRNGLLVQLVLRAAREPGLELQGQNLKLPDVGVKRRTMGGTRAEVFVNFEAGVTAQAFRGLTVLNTSLADGPTVTYSDYAYYTCYVAQSGTEKIENTGAMKRLDILRSRQSQEIRTLVRTMEADLWTTNTDTTAGSQDSFAGLRHKVKLDPTTSTTIQGLSQSTFTPWRNQYVTSVGSFAANGPDNMRAQYYATAGVNAMEPIDLWITTSTVAGYYVKQAEGIHRVVGNIGGAGTDLSSARLPVHMGVPVIHTDDCTSGYMFGLNFKYFENVIHEGADWTDIIPGAPNDQWVEGQHRWVFGAAPLMVTRREKHTVMAGITA